ncbi:hypothetical protein BDP27DRAFT_1443771 [Rhodocollybia butyracea]|uniref:ABC1 atypical kinase-like domain-containing protein n=1 Tax=Rhodocollybia butyracea TaxID=206335 RepID=A0A9P5Q710_9AGAR|nr:hypothetical protein BDP27DRAFT_1443771 [Rhodocollybia butyracea]
MLFLGNSRLLSNIPRQPLFRWNSTKRHASNWSQHSRFPSFFTPAPIARYNLKRRVLWIIPVAGGLALYFNPSSTQKSVIPTLISSPAVIPCRSSTQNSQPVILSPFEDDIDVRSRILSLLRDRVWEPILTAKRFITLCFIFLPVIFSSPMLLIGKPRKKYKGEGWGAVWWYNFLASRMEIAGPTFIKLSQWAASRADLFPAFLCERLGALHSHGKPHSLHHTKRVIERVFQRPFAQVFEEFDEEPIGTGAIAQVYRATLKKDLIPPSYLGPRRHTKKMTAAALNSVTLNSPPPSVPTAAVAIKVLHPKVAKTISRDLSIMSFFAHFISIFPGMQWLSLPEEVEVFGQMMFQQLDLRHEAENLQTFEINFAHRNVPVNFPRPLQVWSTPHLLVEEFENALPLETFLKNGGGPYDEQVATAGLDAFLNMLLLDNFVHSDLHPGNILIKFSKPASTRYLLKMLWMSVTQSFHKSSENETDRSIFIPDYSESDSIVARLRSLSNDRTAWLNELSSLHDSGYIPEIVFIDAGLVTTLSSENRGNFLDLFRALAHFDGYRTGQLMIERCRSPELAIETETFALKMQHLVLSVKRKTFSLGHIKISDILTDVLRAVREHHVKMEGDFINTVISVLLLEGIGRQLDPNLDLFKSSLPILRKLGGQMATRESVSKGLPESNVGAFIKVWVWLEAREFIAASIVNADDLVKYGWLTLGL